ncbi:MAG: PilN domain-containing protein [Pseudomonadota bacterium]
MIRINLLPHREERRRAMRRQLGVLAAGVAALGVAIWLLVHGIIAGYIAVQNDRIDYLKRVNASLDKEIAEIKRLRSEIDAVLSRKQIIETLQSDRARPVLLLEELVRQTPDGVYLTSLKQTGLTVNVTGYAQSSARVSMFMRNLQATDIVENSQTSPRLIEIKAANVNNRRLAAFNMNFKLKPTLSQEEEQAPAKPVQAKSAPAKKG